MRKFGVSSMLTRTHFLGNIEEMTKHTQQMDGPIQPVDSLSIKEMERILVTRTLMKKFMDLLLLIKTFFHGKPEEMMHHIQPMVGLTQQEDLLSTKEKTSLTKRSMKKSGDSSTTIRILYLGNTEEMRRLIQPTVGLTQKVD